jgi:hypothetical protein
VALSAPFFLASAFLFTVKHGSAPVKVPGFSTNILCLITAFFFAADHVVMHIAIR